MQPSQVGAPATPERFRPWAAPAVGSGAEVRRQQDGAELLAAASLGDTTTVRRLLSQGCPANEPAPIPNCRLAMLPLVAAATHGHGDTVELLLRHGADPARALPGSSETALTAAIRFGHPPVVRQLARRCDLLRAYNGRLRRPVDLAWRLCARSGNTQRMEIFRFLARLTDAQALPAIVEDTAEAPRAPLPPRSPSRAAALRAPPASRAPSPPLPGPAPQEQWLRAQALQAPAAQGPALPAPSLPGLPLRDSSLSGPSLSGPSLPDPSLVGPSLRGPLLRGPSLVGPSQPGASLVGPSLSGSSLPGASLPGPLLSGLSLRPLSLQTAPPAVELAGRASSQVPSPPPPPPRHG